MRCVCWSSDSVTSHDRLTVPLNWGICYHLRNNRVNAAVQLHACTYPLQCMCMCMLHVHVLVLVVLQVYRQIYSLVSDNYHAYVRVSGSDGIGTGLVFYGTGLISSESRLSFPPPCR